MSLWKWLLRRAPEEPADSPREPQEGRSSHPLSAGANVFECRECHKVFESRRRRPLCPECESGDVELVSK